MKARRLAAVGVAVAALGLTACTGTRSGDGNATGGSPRTPWNEPDIQGIWDHDLITPVERPDRYANREFLTDEEVAALEAQANDTIGKGRDVRGETGSDADVEGAYNNVFTHTGGRYIATKRTSLVIDPPDGKIPPLTAEEQKLRQDRQSRRQKRMTVGYSPDGRRLAYPVDTGRPIDNPEDRNDSERCQGVTLPCTGGVCVVSRIVQTPGMVSIYYEKGQGGGAYRNIPTDGRPHLPSTFRQWLGDAVGKWEGDTLVVDTTNFTNLTGFRTQRIEGLWEFSGSTDEHLHMIERFTRLSPESLRYQLTVDNPKVYTRPWTMEFVYQRQSEKENMIYESSCYEGNYSLPGMLAGARLEEATRGGKR